MEVKTIEKENSNVIRELLLSNDPVAGELIMAMYQALTETSKKLSINERAWMHMVETNYLDRKALAKNRVEWYITVGNELIEKEQQLNPEEVKLLESLKEVVENSKENKVFSHFFEKLENSAESIFRLDFDQRTEPLEDGTSEGHNLLNYTAMSFNMIADRLRFSVVSNKAVHSILNCVKDKGFIVTDTEYRIRFINQYIEQATGGSYDDYIGLDLSSLIDGNIEEITDEVSFPIEVLPQNRTQAPIKGFITRRSTEKDSGQVDEYVYTFEPRTSVQDMDIHDRLNGILDQLGGEATKSYNGEALAEFKREIRELFNEANRSNVVSPDRVDVHEAVRAGMQNIRNTRNLSEFELTSSISDDCAYFGSPTKVADLVTQLLTISVDNFGSRRKGSRIEVIANNFQNCLLIAILDNSRVKQSTKPPAGYDKLEAIAEDLGGIIELNSVVDTGMNLTVILPFQ